MHRFLSFAIVLGVFAPFIAQAADSSECKGSCARARIATQEGARLYAAGRYTDALEKFEEAQRTFPIPEGLINLSRTERRLGRCSQAMAYALQCADAAPGGDDAIGKAAADLLDHLKASCPDVSLTSQPSGASVWVDDFAGPAATTPWRGRLALGHHVVRLRAPGHADLERSLDVAGEDSILLVLPAMPIVSIHPTAVRAAPAPAAVVAATAVPVNPGPRYAGFTLLGLSGASVLTTVGLAIAYGSARSAAQGEGPSPTTTDRSEATGLRTGYFVTGGFAIASGIASAILLIMDHRPGAPSERTSP